MKGEGRIILIQAPFAQLNGPYPAPYYLKAFFEKRGHPVTVLDHSIALFEKIFSRSGLTRIFADASSAASGAASRTAFGVASSSASRSEVAFPASRFFLEKDLWINSIDRLVAFLRGKDHEWGHFLALANGCLPGGPRVDAYLAQREGEVKVDETKVIATKMLSDVADFISFTLDSGFSLVRYTPLMEASLNSGLRDFASVQKCLDGYIMKSFYRPMLDEEWEKLKAEGKANAPVMIGITIPFPGCLVPALVCAESAKKSFAEGVRTVAGGGYVNTELRFIDNPDFFDYFDYLSFDRGYASLASILEHIGEGQGAASRRLYKTMYRHEGTVVRPDDKATLEKNTLDDEAARTIFPDYSNVDFGRYLYPVDDDNPMHRLWSDGHWLKAYLAHGCYWHSCAFCDVTLDYIKNFIPVDPAVLFTHLQNQAAITGVRGVHFCDEAAPAASLLQFALLNREAGLPLNFWGNIRFEKDFDPDTAAILASGGLLGVSAGLEVASESGLKRLGKGIDLEGAVSACAAFKEAGILTHAYLIYGYWDEDEQEIIDSAEILRQFFAQGLLDSAFWHKFILTRHSRIYAEKQRGLHPDLEVLGDLPLGEGKGKGRSIFALNDLSFKGEERCDKYAEGLERLLACWMGGEVDTEVKRAFSFRVKAPSVPPDLVEKLLDSYARSRDIKRSALPGTAKQGKAAKENILFLPSMPWLRRQGEKAALVWRWRLKEEKLIIGANASPAAAEAATAEAEAEKIAALLESVSRVNDLGAAGFYTLLEESSGSARAKKIWKRLREGGLAVFD